MRSSADGLGALIIDQRRSLDEQTRCYLKTLAEFDCSESWKAEGCISTVAWLVSRTRHDSSAAFSDVSLARRLYGEAANALPTLAASLESGKVSVEGARAVERGTRGLAPEVLETMEPTIAGVAGNLAPAQVRAAVEKAGRLALIEQEKADERARRLAELQLEQARQSNADDVAAREAAIAAAERAAAEALAAEQTRRRAEFDSRSLTRRSVGRMVQIEALLTQLDAENLWALLTPLARPADRRRNERASDALELGSEDLEPDNRTHAQRFADAFVELTRRCQGADQADFLPGPLGGVQVLVDLDDLIARSAEVEPSSTKLPSYELARLCCDATVSVTVGRRAPEDPSKPFAGVASVSNAAASSFAGAGPARVPCAVQDLEVIDKMLLAISPALGGVGFQILQQGRTKRLVTTAQRKALRARDRGCVYPGCDSPFEWTEAHHILEWEHGGSSDLENLASLCSRHHHLLHLKGWSLRADARGGFDVIKQRRS